MLEAKVASVSVEDIYASVNVTPKHRAGPALWILPRFLTHEEMGLRKRWRLGDWS